MKRLLLAIGMAGVLGLGSAKATIDLNDQLRITGTVPNMTVGTLQIDGQNRTSGAGVFAVSVYNITDQFNDGNIYTFCTDAGQWWSSPHNFTAVDFTGETGITPPWNAQGIQNASWLYNTLFTGSSGSFIGAANVAYATAMQFAIWEALYDTGTGGTVDINFNDGRLRWVSGYGGASMLTLAQGYLQQLNTARGNGSFVTYSDIWLKPDPANTQGLIYSFSTPGETTPVPEPGTILAGALLLLPFGAGVVRRFRRK